MRPIPRPRVRTFTVGGKDGFDALRRVEPELAGIAKKDVQRVNTDIKRACAIVIGALPAIRSLLPGIREHLPTHPLEPILKLEDYALATIYAHAMREPPKSDVPEMKKLHKECLTLRRDLLVQVDALAHKKLMRADKVAHIRRGKGYLDTANDLVALSTMFRQEWPAVRDKTTVVQEDCERADVLGRALLLRVAARTRSRKVAPRDPGEDRRARCFTLMMRGHDLAKQAAVYLRWHQGDASRLVPTPYPSRPKGKKRSAKDSNE